MLKSVCSVAPQAGVFLWSKCVKKVPHTLFSLTWFTVRGRLFFFSLSKSEKKLSEVSAPFSICNIYAHFIAAEPQTVRTSAIAWLSLSLQTIHHGQGGLFWTEKKNIFSAALQEASLHLLYHTSAPVISLHYFIFVSSDASYCELLRILHNVFY